MQMIRVLLISQVPPPIGGIATWTVALQEAISHRNEISLDFIDTAVRNRPLVDSNLFQKLVKGGAQAAFTLAKLIASLIFRRPHVVHICSAGELGLSRDSIAIAICRLFFVRVVLHLHRGKTPDYPDLMKGNSIESLFTKLCSYLASKIIVLNEPARMAFPNYTRDRVFVLPNFIDTVNFLPSAKPRNELPIVIGYVGYLIDRKGIRDLISAVRALAQQGCENFELRVIGSGTVEFQSQLVFDASDLISSGRATFLGALPAHAVQQQLQQMDIFCLPSYAEGFPYVVLEAMGSGLCIVSTTVGGIPHMLSNQSGICLPPGDIEMLTSTLFTLIQDADTRTSYGNHARQRCENLFSSHAVVSDLIKLWR